MKKLEDSIYKWSFYKFIYKGIYLISLDNKLIKYFIMHFKYIFLFIERVIIWYFKDLE